jgi:hypothetical protein
LKLNLDFPKKLGGIPKKSCYSLHDSRLRPFGPVVRTV